MLTMFTIERKGEKKWSGARNDYRSVSKPKKCKRLVPGIFTVNRTTPLYRSKIHGIYIPWILYNGELQLESYDASDANCRPHDIYNYFIVLLLLRTTVVCRINKASDQPLIRPSSNFKYICLPTLVRMLLDPDSWLPSTVVVGVPISIGAINAVQARGLAHREK